MVKPEANASIVKPEPTATPVTPATRSYASSNISVTGDFQYGLCSCMDGKTCCRPVWWNSWLFQCFPIAQLLNRFRWNTCASPTQQSRQTTFAMIVGIYLSYYICHIIYSLSYKCTTMTDSNGTTVSATCATSGAWWILGLIVWAIFIYIVVLLTRIRIGFRKHYKIQGNCCADFCTMVCCSCCSVMQMLRQTHDESKHPYKCCNCLTGLDDDAPEIV